MTDKPENPQAFPMSAKDKQGMISCSSSQGMTLRDYFAGQALAGLTTSSDLLEETDVATWAYGYADAMLKERESKC